MSTKENLALRKVPEKKIRGTVFCIYIAVKMHTKPGANSLYGKLISGSLSHKMSTDIGEIYNVLRYSVYSTVLPVYGTNPSASSLLLLSAQSTKTSKCIEIMSYSQIDLNIS